jgi:hypothetical protein
MVALITHIPSNFPFMPEQKLKQLQFEIEGWKRLLGFMVDENIQLKERLAFVLGNGFNQHLLEDAEQFQNSFLHNDEVIRMLRNDVADLDRLMGMEIFEDGKTLQDIDRKLEATRINIVHAEIKFGRLQSAFNRYMNENILRPAAKK